MSLVTIFQLTESAQLKDLGSSVPAAHSKISRSRFERKAP
jgi:hypothetical protein